MSGCICPMAGWCERHRVPKTEHWHKLCQRDDYFQAWDEGRGPGQTKKNDERMEQRKRKVEESKRRKIWLIAWLKLLRSPHDVGIGDTASRLVKQRKKSPIWIASDAHNSLKRLLAQCSCSKTEAVTRLNREYPY